RLRVNPHARGSRPKQSSAPSAVLRALAVPVSYTGAPDRSRYLLRLAVVAVLLPWQSTRRAPNVRLAEPCAIIAPRLLRRRSHLRGDDLEITAVSCDAV